MRSTSGRPRETSPDSLVLLAKPVALLVDELKWLRNQIP